MTKDNNLLGKFSLEGIPPMPRGVPQIEITYDIDSNGILNVSAVEKSSGKEQKITITNDKGRLSADDIERMVKEAEQFKQEDEENVGRIQSKNELENYAYQMKNTLNDEKLSNKISEEDKTTISSKVDETLKWLDENQEGEKTVFEEKKKELESVCMPIMTKAYQSAMPAGGMPGGMPGTSMPTNTNVDVDEGPKIEEVD
jgi:L1 cell adhesion molecule like protein